MLIMKKIAVLVTFILCAIVKITNGQCNYSNIESFPNGFIVECPDTDYELVFSDEFDGLVLDQTKWETQWSSLPPFDRTKWHDRYITTKHIG